jgi:secretion/DNA translocation related CpaE-like protein
MAEVRRIVVVTADLALRAAVVGLATLVGADAEVVTASAGIRSVWRAAHLVVVGADLAGALAASGVPHRSGVVVVADSAPDEALWRATVEIGAAGLIRLPDEERRLVDLMGSAADLSSVNGALVAVVGACGGAGASTLAAGIAITSARASPTLLIDGDPLGGGIDVLLGAEQQQGARWTEFAGTRGRLGADVLGDAVLRVGELSVLSWGRDRAEQLDVDAAAAVLDAAVRGYSRVIVDLPRLAPPGPAGLATGADLAVIVVPATVRATAAAALVAASLAARCRRLQLVVRDAGSGSLSVTEVASVLGLPVAAAWRSESAVEAAARRGDPPLRRARGSLAETCRVLVSSIDDTQVAA